MPRRDVFGRVPSPLDTRDYPMRATLGQLGAAEGYQRRMWRAGTVDLDQGPTPHCVGFAGAGWLQNSPTRSRVSDVIGHVLYGSCKLIDGYSGDGTWIRVLFDVMRRSGLISRYSWAHSIEDLLRWVCNVGPVVVGTNWYESMFDPDPTGWVEVKGGVVGGHAYLIRGYDPRRLAFRCVNSWGADWGDRGEFWVDRFDMVGLLFRDGGEAVGMEQAL